jgi:hypothetical protein
MLYFFFFLEMGGLTNYLLGLAKILPISAFQGARDELPVPGLFSFLFFSFFKLKIVTIILGVYWGLNSGPHACKADSLPLEPLHQPVFFF